jgi:hypothetical protein
MEQLLPRFHKMLLYPSKTFFEYPGIKIPVMMVILWLIPRMKDDSPTAAA